MYQRRRHSAYAVAFQVGRRNVVMGIHYKRASVSALMKADMWAPKLQYLPQFSVGPNTEKDCYLKSNLSL